MNEEDKLLIEYIIVQFKTYDHGLINAMLFTDLFENPHKRIPITRIMIEDYHFIEKVGNHSYRLTRDGWGFNSFEELDKLNAEKIKREKIELELAESNLKANKLNKKIAKRNEQNEKSNRIATWINVGVGLINISLLLWQILKGK